MVSDSQGEPVKFSYITDSSYFDGIIPFVEDSDLLISEGMHGKDDDKGKMIEKGHMVFSDSANLAAKSNIKKLWLTHYSPALTDPAAYEKQVRNIFPDTVISADGQKILLK